MGEIIRGGFIPFRGEGLTEADLEVVKEAFSRVGFEIGEANRRGELTDSIIRNSGLGLTARRRRLTWELFIGVARKVQCGADKVEHGPESA